MPDIGVDVKYLSSRWVWAALLILVLVVVGNLLVGRSRVESAGGTGIVELAFTATLSTSNGQPVSSQYQRVLLNVMSVRLNTSTDLSLSDTDPSWITIPLPAAMPSNIPTQFINTSLNFGSSGTLLTAPLSILQLDLMPLQNLPVFFNFAKVPGETYGQIELVLDSTTPGYAVPLCPQSASAGEGCITYPAVLASSSGLRVLFANSGYAVPTGSVQPLVVNLAVTVGTPPGADPNITGVSINPVITPQGNTLPGTSTPYIPALGQVTGAVANFDLSTTTVTAEYAGTNQIVATTRLQPDGTFLLNLPAPAAPDTTLYDFYVSGSGAYVVKSRVAVSQGACPPCSQGTCPSCNLGTLMVPGSTFGSLSGTVADACNGIGVEAATLKLLVPDTTAKGGAATCDPTGGPPAIPSNCVTVATAATDDLGHYPLPGTPFTNIPVSPPPGVSYYNLDINAAGFNTALPQVASGLSCPASRFPNSCSFNLDHGYLTGAVQISGPNETGNPMDAMVMAEDSGTNNIENLTLAAIAGGSASGTFTISVPDAAPSSDAIPVRNFDLFASVQDLFQGSPQPSSGQLIGTVASVGAPSADCTTISIPALSPMDCAGLGSVYGIVGSMTNPANPSTTSVRLSKNGVQIMETEPNSIVVAPNDNGEGYYNFCAPSDSYLLTRYESGIAQSSSSETITLAKPLIIGSPCASICQDGNPKGTCLLCQPEKAPTLP
ncbi:MAG: hypothetical protein JO189_26145 [Deltaproteobacteria bacterium]|nr:hypothetical protein [Deltaproteobacteria bacterium]